MSSKMQPLISIYDLTLHDYAVYVIKQNDTLDILSECAILRSDEKGLLASTALSFLEGIPTRFKTHGMAVSAVSAAFHLMNKNFYELLAPLSTIHCHRSRYDLSNKRFEYKRIIDAWRVVGGGPDPIKKTHVPITMLKDVPGDGNCAWHTIAYYRALSLNRKDTSGQLTYLKKEFDVHTDSYAEMLYPDNDTEQSKAKEYFARTAQKKSANSDYWADDRVLYFMARAIKMPIFLISDNIVYDMKVPGMENKPRCVFHHTGSHFQPVKSHYIIPQHIRMNAVDYITTLPVSTDTVEKYFADFRKVKTTMTFERTTDPTPAPETPWEDFVSVPAVMDPIDISEPSSPASSFGGLEDVISESVDGAVQSPSPILVNNNVRRQPEPATPADVSNACNKDFTSLFSLIQTALTQSIGSEILGSAIAKAYPIFNIVVAIYNIVRYSRLQYKWYDMTVAITHLVASAAAFISTNVQSAGHSIMYHLYSIASQLFANLRNTADAGEKPGYLICVKSLILLVAGSLVASGKLVLNRILPAFTLANVCGDIVQDVLTYIGRLTGHDFTGRDTVNEIIKAKTQKAQTYLAIPVADWISHTYAEIKTFSQECRDTIQHNRGMAEPVTMGSLMKLVDMMDERLRNLEEEWASRSERPVPVAVHFWSKQGGLGKSTYVKELAAQVAARIRKFNRGVYALQPMSAHAANYYGEHTMHIDELGACASKDATRSAFPKLNDIISGNTVPHPGAALSAKNQIPRPYLVITTANQQLDTMATPLTTEAKAAMITRFVELEFVDPNYKAVNGRDTQRHRKDDFSHISFRTKKKPGSNDFDDLTAAQVADQVAKRIMENVAAFKARSGREVAQRKFEIRGLQAELPDDVAFNTADAAGDSKFVHFIAGHPATGKSRYIVPSVKEACEAMKYELVHVKSKYDAMADVNSYTAQHVLLMDDTFVFNSPDEQKEFFTFFNSLAAGVKLVIMSNYGPKSLLGYMMNPGYTQVSLTVQGLGRRIGWDYTRDAEFAICSHTGPTMTNNRTLDAKAFARSWGEFHTGRNYPVRIGSPKAPLPFTYAESDLWFETNSTDVTTILKELKSAMSPRMAIFAARNKMWNYDVTTIPALIENFVYKVSRELTDAKLYCVIDGRLFYYYNNEYYLGGNEDACHFDTGSNELQVSHHKYPVNKHTVQCAFDDTPEDVERGSHECYILLHQEKMKNSPVWRAVIGVFPPRTNSFFYAIRDKMMGALASFKDWISAHPWISAALAAVTAVIMYWIWSSDVAALNESQVPKDYSMTCDKCWHSEEGFPIFHPDCPGTLHFNEAMGKKKGGKTLKRFSNKVDMFGKTMQGVSSNLTMRDEQLLHDVRAHMHREGILGNEPRGRFRFNNDYVVGYEWNNGAIDLSIAKYSNDYNTADAGFKSFDNRTGRIWNPTTNEECWAAIIEPQLIRFPLHVSSDCAGDLSFCHEGTTYDVSVCYTDDYNDVAWGVLKKGGKVSPVSGITSLKKSLLTAARLNSVTKCCIVSPDTEERYVTYAKCYNDMPHPFITHRSQLRNRGALVSFGYADISFMKPGACGSTIYTTDAGKDFYLGMFIGRDNVTTLSYVFSLLTVEEYNRVISHLNTSDSQKYVPANALYVGEQKNKKVEMPIEIANKIFNKEDAPIQLSAGLTTVAHYPSNRISVDQKKGKRPIWDHQFAQLFGHLKAPVLTKEAIEAEHADKIPGDDNGVKHAELVRLSKALTNVAGDKHPSYGYLEEFSEAAASMGKYWRHKMGGSQFAYTPLDVEEAIWGGRVDAMDLATSTGAAWQSMFPGCTKKSDLFGERGEYKGEAGRKAKELIDYQWNCWKNGTEFILPTSYSLKSETLPTEKIWKKRVINVADPITTVNLKRLLKIIQDKMAELGPESYAQVTMNPLVDFHGLAQRLLKCDYIIDSDTSSFDLTVPETIISAAGIFTKHLVGANATLSTMITTAFKTISSTPSLCGTTMLARQAGMPSGIPCTSWLDATYCMLIVHFAWCTAVSWDNEPEDYYEEVVTYSNGDDTIIGVNAPMDPSCPPFAGIHIKTFMRDVLLMTCTDGAKGGEDLEHKQLPEVSFVSRKFVTIEGNTKYWSGELKPESISGALMYSGTDDRDTNIACVKAWLTDVALKGDTTYDKYIQLCKEVCDLHDLPRRSIVLLDLVQKIQSAQTKGFINPRPIEKTTLSLQDFADISVEELNLQKLLKRYNTTHEELMTTPSTILRQCRDGFIRRGRTLDIAEMVGLTGCLGGGERYDACVRNREGKSLLSVNLPKSWGGPEFYADVFSSFGDKPAQWILDLPNLSEIQDVKKMRSVRRYAQLAWCLRDPRRQATVVEALLSDNEALSGPRAQTTTAEAPTMPASTASAADTSSGNEIGGLLPSNPLPSQAVVQEEQLGYSIGAAKATVALQPTGGVHMEPALLSQTAVAFNLLMAARIPLFKQIRTIGTDLAQGTLIHSIKVNPWNPDLLNKHGLKWANLHRRFNGSLDLQIQTASATNLIGYVMIAYVPKAYSKMPVTQDNLQLFNPIEISLNVNGNATLRVTPTIVGAAVTGIYRDDPDAEYGDVHIMMSTNSSNGFNTPDAQAQIKICACFNEETVYDLPVVDGEGDNDPTDGLDILSKYNGATIVTDGKYADQVNYNEEPVDSNAVLPSTLVPGTTEVRGALYEMGARAVVLGGTKVAIGVPYDQPDVLVALGAEKDMSWDSSNDSFTISRFATQFGTELLNSPEAIITYTNINRSYTNSDWIAQTGKPNSYIALKPAQTNDDMEFLLNNRAVRRSDGTILPDTAVFVGSCGWDWNGTEKPDPSPALLRGAGYRNVETRVTIHGAAVCTNTAISTDSIPLNWFAIRVVDETTIIPTVVQGQDGNSVVLSEAHIDSCYAAMDKVKPFGNKSVLTTLTDGTGTLVAQIVRNQYGMFMNASNSPEYGILTTNFRNLKQDHQVLGQEWPSIVQAAPGAFNSRLVNSPVVVSYLGETRTVGHMSDTKFSTMMQDKLNIKPKLHYRRNQAMASFRSSMPQGNTGLMHGFDYTSVYPNQWDQTQKFVEVTPYDANRPYYNIPATAPTKTASPSTYSAGAGAALQAGAQVQGNRLQFASSMTGTIGNLVNAPWERENRKELATIGGMSTVEAARLLGEANLQVAHVGVDKAGVEGHFNTNIANVHAGAARNVALQHAEASKSVANTERATALGVTGMSNENKIAVQKMLNQNDKVIAEMTNTNQFKMQQIRHGMAVRTAEINRDAEIGKVREANNFRRQFISQQAINAVGAMGSPKFQ